MTNHFPAQQSSDLTLEQAKVEVISRSIALGAKPIKAPVILKYQLTSWQKTYFYRPDLFIADCIVFEEGRGAADYQLEIAEQLPIKKRIAVRGPHRLGKTSLASWLIHWFALTRDGLDWKCPTTAGGWRQLSKFLWPEIHKWSRRLKWNVIGRQPYTANELLTINMKLRTGEAFAAASDKVELIEGAQADHLFYLFDEAKIIPEETFDGAEGAFAGGTQGKTEAYGFAISTPGPPIGRFYDIHARKPGLEEWYARHVTLEEAIAAGRIGRDWAEAKLKLWGENSALYQNRALGEFYASDEDGVIPLGWVEPAVERWRDWKETGGNTFHFTNLGVDVADGGENKTIIGLRFEKAIEKLREYPKQDTMETAGIVNGLLRARGGYAVIDSIGVGSGVLNRVKEENLAGLGFNAGKPCKATDRSGDNGFINLRSAAWWNLREMLDPANGENIMLPPDDELIGDLTTPKWRVMSGGKISVESKGETENWGKGVNARLGRSTDKGDAVVMAFCPKQWIETEPEAFIWVAV